jgi:hypothetical protein
MFPEEYRFYRLDGAGQIHSAEWIKADSDDQATTQVQVQFPDAKCEIWQGKRLVARLSPGATA